MQVAQGYNMLLKSHYELRYRLHPCFFKVGTLALTNWIISNQVGEGSKEVRGGSLKQ